MTSLASPAVSVHSRARAALTVLGLLALLGASIVGGDPVGIRERLFAGSSASGTALPSQPWQGVVTLQGEGTGTAAPFTIGSNAREWRVKWSCESGHLLLLQAGGSPPIVDAACPGSGTGFGAGTGLRSLDVTADGPWQLEVEQHIDPHHRAGSTM